MRDPVANASPHDDRLGWTQEIAGDHAAAQESWRQARSELESLLKEQPENFVQIGDLALTNMGLGDKIAAFKLIERGPWH